MFGNDPPCGCVSTGDGSQLWWPAAYPLTNLDYAANICAELMASGDAVATVALSLQPSGEGEMQALDLSVTGDLVVVQLAGGQPWREYLAQVIVTGVSGRVWPSYVNIICKGGGALFGSAPPPPVAGYGTPITWASGATVFGPAITAVATGLVGTGTNQGTALPLPAQTNIFSSAPAGTGSILNGSIVSGTIVVQNDDLANNLLIYPPVDAVIVAGGVALAVNTPFVLGPQGAKISFATQSPATQWTAG